MNELIKVKKELVKERDAQATQEQRHHHNNTAMTTRRRQQRSSTLLADAQAALIGALKSEVANYTTKIGTMDTELAASSEEMATLKVHSAN